MTSSQQSATPGPEARAESDRHEPELWLIRHGETEWSRTRRHTGRSDLPLTAAGEQAAQALKSRVGSAAFDLVLASPLIRARRTAELAGLTPELEPQAMEWNYGEYEGITTAQIQETRPGWSVWSDSIPGGESLDQVAERADAVIARVRAVASTRAVLVAHAHFLRILAVRWIEQQPHLASRFGLEVATISVLGWDRGVPVVDRWNG
jgi:broad specificity phosphatase PhoE